MRRAGGDSLLPAALAGVGALVLSLALGAVLASFRGTVGLENVAILYMAIVAAAAVAGGWVGGVVAAVAAALSYDFFFTTPYLQLRIDSAEQVGTVGLLFASGIVISFVADVARGRLTGDARAPSARERGTARLVNQLVQARASGHDADRLAVEGLHGLLDARWVGLLSSRANFIGDVVSAGDLPAGVDLEALRWTHEGVAIAASDQAASAPDLPDVGAKIGLHTGRHGAAALVVIPTALHPLSGWAWVTLLAVAHALETGETVAA